MSSAFTNKIELLVESRTITTKFGMPTNAILVKLRLYVTDLIELKEGVPPDMALSQSQSLS